MSYHLSREEKMKRMSMSSFSTRMEDPTVEELEKHVERYRKKLHHESERTKDLARNLKSLQQEVEELKRFLFADADVPDQSLKPSSSSSIERSSSQTSTPSVVSPEVKSSAVNGEPKKIEKEEKRDSTTVVSSPQYSSSTTEEKPRIQTIKGWLEKKGHKPVGKNWAKRWFELTSEGKLKYYENQKSTAPKATIPLVNAVCYARVEKNGKLKPDMFNIRTENRDFLLKAENAETKNRWVAALMSACVRGELSHEDKELMKKASRRSTSLLGSVIEKEEKETEK